ncbi:MAG: FHA domain-containing protein [Bacteroidales bacterium]|nr:FHA domain-containing protein [Bacteroidales bacterium]
MSQQTVKYERSFAGSVGAGVKSVFAGKGRRYYELVHKTRSKYHQEGAVQKIIIDSVELGRDPKCQVRFDESFTTVSRRHAAIVKEGNGWKLIQLSKTNSTYLNGNKVETSWYLQNGDEIQLSTNGPKLGFVAPEGNEGLVKSIGLTNRLSLFRKQALRPYKTALCCLLALLVAACAVGGWLLHQSNSKLIDANQAIEQLTQQQEEEKAKNEEVVAELKKKNQAISSQLSSTTRKVAELQKAGKTEYTPGPAPDMSGNKTLNEAIDALVPGIYFIYTEGFDITTPDGKSAYLKCGEPGVPGWTGTGFLLSDGRFVTARHVIEGWSYWMAGGEIDKELYELNLLVNNGGKVVAHFLGATSTGDNVRFTSDQMIMNRSHDLHDTDDEGYKVSLADYSLQHLDYAYMIFGKSGPIVPDAKLSCNLERMTELTVLGFPLGLGASSRGISPVYGNATVAVNGLQNGGIVTTNTNYESGNSGGPVLARDSSGNLVAVGIVSMSAGRNIGIIVPIAAIY